MKNFINTYTILLLILSIFTIPVISTATILTDPYAAVHGDSVTGTVVTQNVVHLAVGSSNAGANRFQFQAGETGSITAIADGGGGELTITAAGHTLSAGEIVALIGGTGYDELYEVQSISGDDFNVTGVYAATGTGNYIRGVNFTALVGSAGTYEAGGGFTGRNSTGSARFEFYLVKNTTTILVFGRTFANSTDTGNTGSEGAIVEISEGDKISFGFKNLTGTSDIDQDVLDIIIKRLAR